MDVELINKDKKNNKITLLISKTTPSFVNTLRRSLISDVPTMAIETLEFKKNNSALYDEIIAHRVGLIPLKTDLKSYNIKSQCKCEGKGCARCELKITLSAKGPGIIYSGDMKTSDPKVKPVMENMPIVELLSGQEIEFEATAILSNGGDHAKWAPGHAFFTGKPTITVNNTHADFEKFKHRFPPQVFDKSGKIDKNLIVDKNLVDACDGVNENIVKIEYSNIDFIFTFESWGQLSDKEAMTVAMEKFEEKLDAFAKAIDSL